MCMDFPCIDARLDVPEGRIVAQRLMPHEIVLELESREQTCLCPRGAHPCLPTGETPRTRTLRDLPLLHRFTRLVVRIRIARGKMAAEEDVEVVVVVVAGDGSTYDMGLTPTSGAIFRGLDFWYFCYDNESYGNTGDHIATLPGGPDQQSPQSQDATRFQAIHCPRSMSDRLALRSGAYRRVCPSGSRDWHLCPQNWSQVG